MSERQRADAEALRAKYARTFGVPKAMVEVELLEDEDARVFCRQDHRLPVWTLAPPRAAWATNHKVKTFE